MSALLNQAIASLNLRPGQSIRTTVNGNEVEVRMLEKAKPATEPEEERSQFEDMVMLQPWFEIPPSPNARIVTVQRGEEQWPSPIVIDESDLAPE